MHSRKEMVFWIGLFSISLILAACQPSTAVVEPTSSSSPAGEVQSATLPLSTPTPLQRSLVICLGQEPLTLYRYGGSSRSMWSVLEAIYDGPFDTRQYSTQPVILKKMPNLADGDAEFKPVEVQAGDEVLDVNRNLVTLEEGVIVIPSECSSADCAITWDGRSSLKMDRLAVTFELIPGITWSDGAPLTAEDSVYSFELSADPDTPVSKRNIYNTESYEVLDELTVQWTGKPGFFPERYATYFWLPLPRHAWEMISPAELLQADESTRYPIGWGPYMIVDWAKGDHISLRKNPNYFRSSEGLPAFDDLVFRFIGDRADNLLAALLTGECDIVDQSAILDEELESILALEQAGEIKAFIGQGPEWEHVDFGIKPSSYDDGYNPFGPDRPDFFSDVRVRQAFAYCMNRQGIVDRWLLGKSSVPASYLPPDHPLFLSDLMPLPDDTTKGSLLLDEVGWKDLDGDPTTPRVAVGVENVPDGTLLAVNYATTKASLRMKIAQHMAEYLGECGVQLYVQYYELDEFYAPGPEGLVFGRNFDLVQFGWKTGFQPPCILYESEQIPTTENNWLTVNVSGYSNPEYDAACRAARQTRMDDVELHLERQGEVQRIFAAELPVVPLYFKLKAVVARPDICGLEMNTTNRSMLWNLEALDYGMGCK